MNRYDEKINIYLFISWKKHATLYIELIVIRKRWNGYKMSSVDAEGVKLL